MNSRSFVLRSHHLLVLFACLAFGMLEGCGTYVPKGSTVVKITNSRHEFDRADLRATHNELSQGHVIPMKWYDTNTFMTSATLQPGTYTMRARNYEGAAISRDIAMVADKGLYEIDAGANAASSADLAAGGPEIRGKLQSVPGKKMPSSVAVLFIGRQVALQTAQVGQDGSFSLQAPAKGSWRIEVHLLGDSPLSYVRPAGPIDGPVNMGTVILK